MSRRNTVTNVWTERFDGLDDPATIRARTAIPPRPLPDLMKLPRHQAGSALNSELERVFVPTESACEMLAAHVQRARVFAQLRYPDRLAFLKTPSAKDAEAYLATSAWCLTGPAGVGKSAVMAALERLMPPPGLLKVDEHYPEIPQRAMHRLVVGAQGQQNDVFLPLCSPAMLSPRQRTTLGKMTEHIRDWFVRTGLCSLIGDELQFVTQSAGANTRVAQILLTLMVLAVPVTFVANYSLVHRLLKRPQEERQRLLAEPLLMLPDAADSRCWVEVLQAFLGAAPGAFAYEAASWTGELHRLTGGVKRILRQLLVLSLKRVHSRTRDRVVTLEDLRDAYRSAEFTANRDDVEGSALLQTSASRSGRHLDLVCPFADVLPVSTRLKPASVASDRSFRVADAVLQGALTKPERLAAAALQRAADVRQSEGDPKDSGTVTPLRKRSPGPPTLQSLLAGSAAADRLSAARGKKPPKRS